MYMAYFSGLNFREYPHYLYGLKYGSNVSPILDQVNSPIDLGIPKNIDATPPKTHLSDTSTTGTAPDDDTEGTTAWLNFTRPLGIENRSGALYD